MTFSFFSCHVKYCRWWQTRENKSEALRWGLNEYKPWKWAAAFGIVITVSQCHLKKLTHSVIVAVMQMTATQRKPVEFKFQILFGGTNSIAILLTEHWSSIKCTTVVTRNGYGRWKGKLPLCVCVCSLNHNVGGAGLSLLWQIPTRAPCASCTEWENTPQQNASPPNWNFEV